MSALFSSALGWLSANKSRALLALNLFALVVLGGVCWGQRLALIELQDWQSGVLSSLSQAADQRNSKGQLLPVMAKDAQAHIAVLGRLKIDIAAAQSKARAADAENALTKEQLSNAVNREARNDYELRIDLAREKAATLRSAAAAGTSSVREAVGATGADNGGSGNAPLSAIFIAGPGADEASGAVGLPVCTAMTIEERLLATEQAIQLDDLISTVLKLAEVHNQ